MKKLLKIKERVEAIKVQARQKLLGGELCQSPCGHPSYLFRQCIDCETKELGKIIGDEKAIEYTKALLNLNELEVSLYHSIQE